MAPKCFDHWTTWAGLFAWVVDDAKCIMVTRVCVWLSVCLSARSRMPTLLHGPGCNLESGRGYPLVVHYWADLQSVHGLRCYGNITRTWYVSEYMLVLVLWLAVVVVVVVAAAATTTTTTTVAAWYAETCRLLFFVGHIIIEINAVWQQISRTHFVRAERNMAHW